MKEIMITVTFIISFWPITIFAGTIFGSVHPPRQDIEIKVTYENGNNFIGYTDDLGTYRIYVSRKGRYTLSLKFNNEWLAPIQINSYDKPVRCDLDVITERGRYILKRR